MFLERSQEDKKLIWDGWKYIYPDAMHVEMVKSLGKTAARLQDIVKSETGGQLELTADEAKRLYLWLNAFEGFREMERQFDKEKGLFPPEK